MILGIHHIALNTANFDAMVKFYHDAFGFVQVGPVTEWTPSDFGARFLGVKNAAGKLTTLKAGNTYLELFQYDSPPGRPGGPARPNDQGYTHFCVEVRDIDQEIGRLTALGMKFPFDKAPNLGAVKSVYGTDPDGNVVELREAIDPGEFPFEDLGFTPTKS